MSGFVLFLQHFLFTPFKTSLVETLEWKDLRCSLSLDVMGVFAVSFNKLRMFCFYLLLPVPVTELDKNLKKRYNCCMSCQNRISLIKMNEKERHLLFPLQSQGQRQCLLTAQVCQKYIQLT